MQSDSRRTIKPAGIPRLSQGSAPPSVADSFGYFGFRGHSGGRFVFSTLHAAAFQYMENIRYGRRGATDGEVILAAKKAHCHAFIEILPEKYQTYVGERQWVAIARAILKDAPILVLDEATSSLDSESEALIQDALRTLMEGKTVIVIAHRLSTIMKMDRIMVIKNGAIVAEGNHNDLLKQNGLYQKLWNIQAGGFRS